MKAYKIFFDGMHLGGKAVVIASSKKKAIEKLFKDYPNKEWEKEAEVTDEYPLNKTQTIYYDNGDY